MSQTLAFDLGGSSLKLAIVAADGAFLGQVRIPLQIRNDSDHHYEVDPLVWWLAFQQGCAELAAKGHDFALIKAVAGCGFTRTQVFLDHTGASIRPAISFQDSRAADILNTIRAEIAVSGSTAMEKLGPFDPLARLLWLRHAEPHNWARLHKIIEPKDYLNLMLTGIAASDTISQTPMTRARSAGDGDILAVLGIDASILPDMQSPFALLGHVQTGLQYPLSEIEGAPVYCGSLDTWSCVLGSGGLEPGVGYSISGTSDVSGVMSSTRTEANGLLTVEWGPDLWQLGGPSQGAATRLQWAVDRFAPGTPMETALAQAFASDDPAPLFLPYLDGERTPWWDSDLQGAFLGLSAAHTGSDFLRGVAEGINYLSREVLVRAEEATGTPVTHICFSGGLANSSLLCQLKADVLNRTVVVPNNPETGLVGAARLPRRTGTSDTVEASTIYKPDPARLRYHDDRFSIFQTATEAIKPLSHRMRQLDKS